MASCKERWRNIRAAFARSINIYKTHSGPNRVKPYYLHKELSFLVKPMMEGRDKKDDYDDSQESGGGGIKDEDVANVEENEGDDDDDDEEEQAEDDDTDFPDDTADIKSAFEALNPDIRIQAETRYQKMLRNNNNNNNGSSDLDLSSNIFEPHTEFSTASDPETEFHFPDDNLHAQNELERNRHNNMTNSSPPNGFKRPMHLETETFESKKFKLSSPQMVASENDIKFLEALLPDMALMNTRQKIVFKKEIYQILEKVFENSNDFPNIEQCKIEHNKASNNNLTSAVTCNANNNNINFNNLNASSSLQGGSQQVRQTVLTVNSSTARTLINNIASLNEAELQRVNGFLQNNLRSPQNANNRLTNVSNNMPSSAAAKLMSSTPKITITKVTCPPPAALRSMNMNKPPSPCANAVSTTIHHHTAVAMGSSNVHSTTSSNPTATAQTNSGSSSTNNNNNSAAWNQIMPITIKDEIEDVDIV